MQRSQLWVWAFDVHYPKIDKPTFRALLEFLKHNRVAGFGFGGDQFDNADVSHHNKGKSRNIKTAAINRDAEGFDREILKPIEALLPRDCEKIYLEGNHCDFIAQYIDEHPELEGSIERRKTLRLDERSWEFIPCGKSFKKGHLRIVHGECIPGGGQAAAKNALHQYCGSVLFGHFHNLQMASKVMPHDHNQKWAAYCSPIIGSVNASYLRNKPTNWVNGFTVVELQPNGNFNCWPLVVIKGSFSYGGRIYRG